MVTMLHLGQRNTNYVLLGPPFGGATGRECTRGNRDILRAKGYRVAYQEFMGGHDDACWQGTIADGILALSGRAPEESAAE